MTTTDKISAINQYLMFMWNRWDHIQISRFCSKMGFEDIEDHLTQKWVNCVESAGYVGAPAMFWSELSENIQKALLEFIEKWVY